MGFGKTHDGHAPVMVVMNISRLSGNHHGHDCHGFYPCLKNLVLRHVEMGQGDRTLFYLVCFVLEYRQNNYVKVEKFAPLAKVKAVEINHKMEAFQASKHFDFLRAITRGHTIDNGPKQSESERENADISSSGADSDWLTADHTY